MLGSPGYRVLLRMPPVALRGGDPPVAGASLHPLEAGRGLTRVARSQLTTTHIPKHLPGRRDGKDTCCIQNGANSGILGGCPVRTRQLPASHQQRSCPAAHRLLPDGISLTDR